MSLAHLVLSTASGIFYEELNYGEIILSNQNTNHYLSSWGLLVFGV